MRKIAIVAVVACAVLGGESGYANDDEVSLSVTPQVSFAIQGKRNPVRVIIRIERHPDNRLLRLEWDAPDGEGGSSQKMLEGENSPGCFWGEDFLGRSGLMLTAGHYRIKAILIRVTKGKEKQFSAQAEIKIVRAGENEEDR